MSNIEEISAAIKQSKDNEKDFLLIIDGSSLLTTQFFGNLPKEIMFAKTPEEKERFFPKIMQTSKGIYTNAVYGFLRVLLKIIKEQKPTYLAVTWDVSRNTFRREKYPDYKGNRGETLAPLKDQFKLCQEILSDLGVKQFMDQRYEADDFSGTLSTKFESSVPVRIMTKDNDYLQLITKDTNVWLIHSTAKKTDELYDKYGFKREDVNAPDRTFFFTPELVKAEFGIWPSSVPSLKGIQGDSSDNIKGVPGVGEATATALISEYETVDHLYDVIRDLDDAGKKQVAEFWKTLGIKRSPMNALLKKSDTELVGEEAAKLSTWLATIKKDIDLDITLEDLKVHLNQELGQKRFDELEFKSLKIASFLKEDKKPDQDGFISMEDVEATPFDTSESNPFAEATLKDNEENLFFAGSSESAKSQTGKGKAGSSESTEENSLNTQGRTFENLSMLLENTKKQSLEENGPVMETQISDMISSMELISDKEQADKIWDDIVGKAGAYIGFYVAMEEGQAVAVSICYQKDKICCFMINDQITMTYINDQFGRLYEKKITCCTLGLKRTLSLLHPLKCSPVADVSLAAYLINPNINDYEYPRVALDYLKVTLEDKKAVMGKQNLMELYTFAADQFKKAVGYECSVAFLAYPIVMDCLNAMSLKQLYDEIEMPLIFTLFDMEQRGIRVNKEALREYGASLTEKIKELEKDIYQMSGEEFNINSPKQLGEILFEKMKLPYGKKTKTGYSTSADVLEKIKLEDPIIEKILEYRQLTKLKSTYADGLAGYVQADGRIHGTFNQTITATGRISSTEPNLQNIPIRMELGRQIRKVFIPEDGYVFLDADYSQIELRVLAHMSQDERLIDAYRQKQDIHRLTASQVFHTPFEEVTSLQRSNAKAVNFGIVYGISSFSLGQDLNTSRAEAEEYITQYFKTYPRVKEYLDSLILTGKETGYVETMFHRLRPVPDLTNPNFMKRSAEERIAMNSPIQGTAADIIKIAMIRVNEALKNRKLKSRLLLQIHDELLVEAYEPEIEEVKELMKTEMEQAVSLAVPMIADVNMGTNWYDAK